ncbi:MAG TPA: rhomboid family intramembrane serine protease [Armatimonadota bacterium]|nr:rhomboid family intramembrane serine protease [Armatimonadota bacterium]HOJ22206.1 rhomboid family intramembrane serine protease [Armatimonadota bacterium]HOM81294.1 rhomboid family intramembrane serine protease [Armatimonadota bacterium]HPO74961.1 rhomboid family intramembrane serine protease [Armatimonadota bacterium]
MIPVRDDVPSISRPVVMYAIIVVNVLVYLYMLAIGPRGVGEVVSSFGVVPVLFTRDPAGTDLLAVYPTLLTSIFLHGGLLHLLVNMWYLWIFGDNVEDRMGHGKFLIFYLMGGVVANLAHIGLNPLSPIPSIGASGAVAGVLGAYLVLFPGARIITIVPFIFVFAIQLPAGLVLGVWFIIQLWSGLGSIGVDGTAGGIAYWAHIGGFLFGLLVVRFLAPRRRRRMRREWEPRERPSW